MRISDWSSDVCSSDLLLRQRDDLHRRSERFVRTLPLVADAEAVARHADSTQFVDPPGRERALGAAPIEDEADIGHVLASGQQGDAVFCAGKLRHLLRADETRLLYLALVIPTPSMGQRP